MKSFDFPHIPLSLPLAGALIAGIAWSFFCWTIYAPIIFFVTIFVALWSTPQIKTKKYLFYFSLLALTFLVGVMAYQEQRRKFFRTYYRTVGKSWTVIAKVTDIEKSYRVFGETLITLKLKKVFNDTKEAPGTANKKLKIKTKSTPKILIGDTVEIKNIFLRWCSNRDFMSYMIKENLIGYVYLKNPEVKIIERPKWCLMRKIRNLRNSVVERLHKKLSKKTFTLVTSIFLGKKLLDNEAIDKIRDQMKVWGTVHHLARSGLHLIIFIILFTFFLGYIPIPFYLKELVTLVLVLFYALFSWVSLSFMRATILLFFYKFCSIQKLQTHAVHLISLVALFLLIKNPYQLFFLDFQLSFLFAISIAWMRNYR